MHAFQRQHESSQCEYLTKILPILTIEIASFSYQNLMVHGYKLLRLHNLSFESFWKFNDSCKII